MKYSKEIQDELYEALSAIVGDLLLNVYVSILDGHGFPSKEIKDKMIKALAKMEGK